MAVTIPNGVTPDRQTVSIRKACQLVDVGRRTIYNWIASGKVETIRTAGGSVRIFVDTLWRTPDDLAIASGDRGGVDVAPPDPGSRLDTSGSGTEHPRATA